MLRAVPGLQLSVSNYYLLLAFVYILFLGFFFEVQKHPEPVQVKGVCVWELMLIYRDLVEAKNRKLSTTSCIGMNWKVKIMASWGSVLSQHLLSPQPFHLPVPHISSCIFLVLGPTWLISPIIC